MATWLEYIGVIGTIATPILLSVFAIVGWRLRNRLERRAQLEDQLRPDRVGIYNDILEPFIILLTKEEAWKTDSKLAGKNKDEYATSILLSVDYRRKAFQMSLVGSDGVVKAYNDMMQFFYQRGADPKAAKTTDSLKL